MAKKIEIGEMHLRGHAEAFCKASSLTDLASQQLMLMHDNAMDSPGGKYEYPSSTIYQIAALLELVSNQLMERESFINDLLRDQSLKLAA